VAYRVLDALYGVGSEAVEAFFPRRRIQEILHRAFPDECFHLASLAERHGMRFIEVDNLNSDSAAEALTALKPDLAIVLGTRVLRRSTFGVPRLGSINLHKGALPRYRGMPPGFWELYNGEKSAGVTVHFVDDTLDTGDVIASSEVEISPLDTPDSLLGKLHLAGANTLAEAVSAIESGTATRVCQQDRRQKAYTRPTRKQISELRRRLPHWRRQSALKGTLKNLLALALYYSGIFWLVRRCHRYRGSRGAVVLYHRVNDIAEWNDPLTTNRERFAGHMLMISQWYKPISSNSLVRHIRERIPVPATSVAIHFDDCYRDVYRNAWPIMRASGVPGAAFVSSGFVGASRAFAHDRLKSPFQFENLTEPDLREMAAGGFEIGAHTINHVDLGTAPLAEAVREIEGSVRSLERLTGSPIRLFSFPFGGQRNFRRELRPTVESAGCEGIFSAHGGFIDSATDPYAIPRLGASSMNSPLALALELEGLAPGALIARLRSCIGGGRASSRRAAMRAGLE
jgi:peptidoglycan/xylan/chitin deacetylase (PgdA/CDA1 family)/folate-dependent phosphoribosylglycinamide formyltransferase PurN